MDLPQEHRFTVLIKYFMMKKVSETEFSNEGIVASLSMLNTFLKSALMFAGKYGTDFLLAAGCLMVLPLRRFPIYFSFQKLR